MYDTPNNPGNYQDSVLLPPYVLPNSPAAIWYAEHVPFGWEKPVWEEEEDDEVETDNTASSSSDDLGEYDSDEDEHYYDSDEDDDDDDEEEHYYRTEAEYYSSDDDDDEYSNGEDDEDNWDRAEISEQIGVKSLYQSDQPKQQSQSTEPSCLSPIASEDPTKAPFICSDGPSRHETLEFKWSR